MLHLDQPAVLRSRVEDGCALPLAPPEGVMQPIPRLQATEEVSKILRERRLAMPEQISFRSRVRAAVTRFGERFRSGHDSREFLRSSLRQAAVVGAAAGMTTVAAVFLSESELTPELPFMPQTEQPSPEIASPAPPVTTEDSPRVVDMGAVEEVGYSRPIVIEAAPSLPDTTEEPVGVPTTSTTTIAPVSIEVERAPAVFVPDSVPDEDESIDDPDDVEEVPDTTVPDEVVVPTEPPDVTIPPEVEPEPEPVPEIVPELEEVIPLLGSE